MRMVMVVPLAETGTRNWWGVDWVKRAIMRVRLVFVEIFNVVRSSSDLSGFIGMASEMRVRLVERPRLMTVSCMGVGRVIFIVEVLD